MRLINNEKNSKYVLNGYCHYGMHSTVQKFILRSN